MSDAACYIYSCLCDCKVFVNQMVGLKGTVPHGRTYRPGDGKPVRFGGPVSNNYKQILWGWQFGLSRWVAHRHDLQSCQTDDSADRHLALARAISTDRRESSSIRAFNRCPS